MYYLSAYAIVRAECFFTISIIKRNLAINVAYWSGIEIPSIQKQYYYLYQLLIPFPLNTHCHCRVCISKFDTNFVIITIVELQVRQVIMIHIYLVFIICGYQ